MGNTQNVEHDSLEMPQKELYFHQFKLDIREFKLQIHQFGVNLQANIDIFGLGLMLQAKLNQVESVNLKAMGHKYAG